MVKVVRLLIEAEGALPCSVLESELRQKCMYMLKVVSSEKNVSIKYKVIVE